ncbi:bacillithiol system protein YtxJ [Arenibacter nanhaiticus]|uniref:Bacillithiol system protein YtxJ n=1 Tax=Arenibacter nanhaiticus TaxID=558155 RepID=A0A1M6K1C2_9FLAO|nr:bacillithiol system redox-active protein YtxJ [Arenibacter nanhaiticus]SHJ52704.1 bacillithiol system protein YtxJ [Arenibacter nanhaiticus]
MGLFNNLFGNKNIQEKREAKELPWIPLTSLEQLDEIKEKSLQKTQVIFKHSTTCGISSMVMKRFKEAYDMPENSVDLYYLDLLRFREVSNEVGYKFQIIHESPQLLIIKNEVVVAHESHGAISQLSLQKYI